MFLNYLITFKNAHYVMLSQKKIHDPIMNNTSCTELFQFCPPHIYLYKQIFSPYKHKFIYVYLHGRKQLEI